MLLFKVLDSVFHTCVLAFVNKIEVVAFLVHGKVWNAVFVLPKQSVQWKGNLQLCKY